MSEVEAPSHLMNSIQQLLENVSRIARHHEELRRVRGETFNIFSILRVENQEAAHSQFLKEMLDPKGAHGMGDAFLKLFVERVAPDLKDFQTENAQVKTEVHLGAKTETTGGRIDIKVSANGKILLIENKIWAGDQEKQVSRYLADPKSPLVVYLTLDGRNPSCKIAKEDEGRLKCISYRDDVLSWLKECQKIAIEHPILRETIRQYMLILQQLTNRNPDIMSAEIVEQVLKRSDSLDAYFRMTSPSLGDAIRKNLWEKMVCELQQEAVKKNLRVSEGANDQNEVRYYSAQLAGLKLTRDELENNSLAIFFQFQGGNNKDLGFGISKGTNFRESNIHQVIRSLFAEKFGRNEIETNFQWWVAYKRWDGDSIWKNWNEESYKKLYSFDPKNPQQCDFIIAVMDRAKEMLEIVEKARASAENLPET